MMLRVFSIMTMSDAGNGNGNENKNRNGNGNGFGSARLNRLLRAVADQRRRNVLYVLEDLDSDVISLDDLADEVLANDLEFDDIDRVRLLLHHRDIPKLSEAHLLEYDSRNKTIRCRFETEVEDFIDQIRALER